MPGSAYRNAEARAQAAGLEPWERWTLISQDSTTGRASLANWREEAARHAPHKNKYWPSGGRRTQLESINRQAVATTISFRQFPAQTGQSTCSHSHFLVFGAAFEPISVPDAVRLKAGFIQIAVIGLCIASDVGRSKLNARGADYL
jgi:hypothetical protein